MSNNDFLDKIPKEKVSRELKLATGKALIHIAKIIRQYKLLKYDHLEVKKDLAHDIAWESLLKVYSKNLWNEEIASFSTFIDKVIENRVKDWAKTEKKRILKEMNDPSFYDNIHPLRPHNENTESTLIYQKTIKQLKEFLNNDAIAQKCLELQDLGFSRKEIIEQTPYSEGQIDKAKQRLSDIAHRYYQIKRHKNKKSTPRSIISKGDENE